MATDRVEDGMLGYDVGQVPAQPVIITEPNKGMVKNLKPALRELVLDTPGNRAYGVDYDSETVGVQYVQVDSEGGKQYTMPKQRVATPVTGIDVGDGTKLLPHEYMAYLTLRDVFAEVAREDSELLATVVEHAAGSTVSDAVVSKAREDVSDFIDL